MVEIVTSALLLTRRYFPRHRQRTRCLDAWNSHSALHVRLQFACHDDIVQRVQLPQAERIVKRLRWNPRQPPVHRHLGDVIHSSGESPQFSSTLYRPTLVAYLRDLGEKAEDE